MKQAHPGYTENIIQNTGNWFFQGRYLTYTKQKIFHRVKLQRLRANCELRKGEAGFYGTCALAILASRSWPYMVWLCSHLSNISYGGDHWLVEFSQYSQTACASLPIRTLMFSFWPYMETAKLTRNRTSGTERTKRKYDGDHLDDELYRRLGEVSLLML